MDFIETPTHYSEPISSRTLYSLVESSERPQERNPNIPFRIPLESFIIRLDPFRDITSQTDRIDSMRPNNASKGDWGGGANTIRDNLRTNLRRNRGFQDQNQYFRRQHRG